MSHYRHPSLYFEDGNIVFLTSEGTLFRFHKTLLALHSSFFSDMFSLASSPSPKATKGKNDSTNNAPDAQPADLGDGSSDTSAIRLTSGGGSGPGITNQEMEMIGKIVYRSVFQSVATLPIPEALSALHVATKFMFDDLRKKILEVLDSAYLDPWQQYSIAVDNGIEDWLLPSYFGICTLIDTPSVKNSSEFVRRHEFDDFVRISAAREEYRTRLIVYALNAAQLHPYTAANTDEDPSAFAGCSQAACRNKIKRVLSSLFMYGKAQPAQGVSPQTIYEYVSQATGPVAEPAANRLCGVCREKGTRLMSEAMGRRQLEGELKKLLQL